MPGREVFLEAANLVPEQESLAPLEALGAILERGRAAVPEAERPVLDRVYAAGLEERGAVRESEAVQFRERQVQNVGGTSSSAMRTAPHHCRCQLAGAWMPVLRAVPKGSSPTWICTPQSPKLQIQVLMRIRTPRKSQWSLRQHAHRLQ